MSTLLSSQSMEPFRAGTVRNPFHPRGEVRQKASRIVLDYPSRINTMAIDPSKVSVDCGGRYEPGEILLSVDIPLRLDIAVSEGTGLRTSTGRTALVLHAKGLMEAALGRRFALSVKTSGEEFPHCGFGSSGRLLAGLAAGINALFGEPFSPAELQQYMARNHGEEVEGAGDLLVPVQCIGGALSSGLNEGGFQVIAGPSRLIAACRVPSRLKVVVGWPQSRPFADSREAMAAEMANMDQFYRIGVEHGPEIAYRVLHELLPALQAGDFAAAGDVIEWYRYDLGSNAACSFSHPDMMSWAGQLRASKERLGILLCGISSVGPAVYAVTDRPDAVAGFLSGLGLRTRTAGFWNDRFRIVGME